MTYQETVAEEVASRYGCAVSPSCVQIVPRGVSGLPDPLTPGLHWRDAARRNAGIWQRGERIRRAAETPKVKKPRETPEAKLARLRAACAVAGAKRLAILEVERLARIAALAKAVPLAASVREAAETLGIPVCTAVRLCRKHGIKARAAVVVAA